MKMRDGTFTIVLRFASVLIVLANSPACAASIGIAGTPISWKALESLEDSSVLYSLAVFLLLGTPFMYTDVCELAAEEEEEEKSKDREARKSPSFGSRKRSSKRHLIIFGVVSVMVVLALMPMKDIAVRSDVDVTAQDEMKAVQEAALRVLETGRVEAPTLHGHVASDLTVASALSVLLVVGLLTGNYDLREMEAEERLKEENAKKSPQSDKKQAKLQPKEAPALSLPLVWQLAGYVAMLNVAAMSALALHRRCLQAGSGTVSATPRLPFTPVASNAATIALTAVFMLLGVATMSVDFRTFAIEEEQKIEKQVSPSNGDKLKRGAKEPKGAPWYSKHWRSVSCAVLLLSAVLGAAATLTGAD